MAGHFYRVGVQFQEGGKWWPLLMTRAELNYTYDTGIYCGAHVSSLRSGNLIYDYKLAELNLRPWRLAPEAKCSPVPMMEAA